MNKIPWRELAEGMLENERKMRPLHRPPSTGCLVTWRDRVLVGCVQHPVDPQYPAVVFLSVTSKYFDPEYVRAIRNLDPGRLELAADPQMEIGAGNFHVLRRQGGRLTFMTADETEAMDKRPFAITQLTPTGKGIHFETIIPLVQPEQKPE